MRERWPLAPLTQEWNENNALLRLLPLTSDQTVELRRCSPVPLSIPNVARGTVSVPQKQNCPFPSYVCGGYESQRKKHSTIASRWISLLCVFCVESFSWVGWGGGADSHFCSRSQRVRVCHSHTRCHTRAQSGLAGRRVRRGKRFWVVHCF